MAPRLYRAFLCLYPAEFREDFGKLFDKHQVQVIFSGHDHSYQRTVRISNGTRERSDTGTVQVVTGGAGNQFDAKGKSPWNVLHAKLYHYLRVETNDDEMRMDCITQEGKLFESWKLKRVGQPETLKAPLE